jgi:hypothetical protein
MNLVALSIIVDHGKSLSVWCQEKVQHQWVPRVGIPNPLGIGYGRWSYGEPSCNCLEHRGDSHPMYMDVKNCTCVGCAQSSYW